MRQPEQVSRAMLFPFVHPAFIAAVFYVIPNLFPFLTPGKRSLAGGTNFLG
jgi:hypothetical protein